MLKFTSPWGWDFNEPRTELIKVSSRGLVGNDRAEFIKRASHIFLPQLDQLKLAEDEIPVHLIALGATEFYGPNRNGDGFSVKACRDRHSTFTKFAKFFRNHKNKPANGDPHFGQVKLSAYNEDMGRVELIVTLNATKKAAERNGGLVADAELEKLANGEDIGVSMACRVTFDSCSYCGNEAKTRKDYCTSSTCDAGGCSEKLAQLVKVGNDLHHLHVDNPEPTWFDISRVYRPADRIAFGGKAGYLTKAASAEDFLGLQQEVAEKAASVAPLDVLLYSDHSHEFWSEREISQLKLAYALASLEGSTSAAECHGIPAALTAGADALQTSKLASFSKSALAEVLAALADQKIILPLGAYAAITGQSEHLKQAELLLPTIYSYGLETEKLAQAIKQRSIDIGSCPASSSGRQIAANLYGDFSLEKTAVELRAASRVIRNASVPRLLSTHCTRLSDVSAQAEKLAMSYADYKLQSLYRIAAFDNQFPLTAILSVRQNQLAS